MQVNHDFCDSYLSFKVSFKRRIIDVFLKECKLIWGQGQQVAHQDMWKKVGPPPPPQGVKKTLTP